LFGCTLKRVPPHLAAIAGPFEVENSPGKLSNYRSLGARACAGGDGTKRAEIDEAVIGYATRPGGARFPIDLIRRGCDIIV